MNHVALIGHLGGTPRLGATNDSAYARFSMVTAVTRRDREGRLHTRSDWHQVLAFGHLVETLEGLQQDDRIAVTGRLQTAYYGGGAARRKVVEIVAFEVEVLEVAPRQGRVRSAEAAACPQKDSGR